MRNWIFQANPKRYDFFPDVATADMPESWIVSRHFGDLQPGDRAALWLSGKCSGIYALGTVAGPTFEASMDNAWLRPQDRGEKRVFCPLKLRRINPPLARADLLADPRFRLARIIRFPNARSPMLTRDEEWAVLSELRALRASDSGSEPLIGHAALRLPINSRQRIMNCSRRASDDGALSILK